jgi:hypothetical protein
LALALPLCVQVRQYGVVPVLAVSRKSSQR